MSTEQESPTKRCLQCKEEKPLTEFRVRGGMRNPNCTTCGKKNSKRYNNMGHPVRPNRFA